jgi:hypothetical protein
VSCNSTPESCTKKLKYFERADSPVIAVRNKIKTNNDSCVYNIDYNYWFPDRYVSTKGKLLISDSSFSIKLNELETGFVKYFDFSKKIGETYSIVLFERKEKKYTINIVIEDIVTVNDRKYYVFKFFNSFEFDNNWTDTVIIASLNEGIIGSYFIYEYEGSKNMVSPQGDILKNHLDYSDIEIRYIK